METKLKNQGLFAVYLLGFLFAFHTAIPTYINSSFLNGFIPEKMMGIIYVIGSFLTIVCFLFMPFILKRFGNYKTAFTLIVLELIALLGLAFLKSPVWLAVLFIVNMITITLIYFSTDIFLEGFSSNKSTGLVRGIYLTAVNGAWALSPFLAGLILTGNDYWKIYLASFIFLVPVFFILISSLRQFKDSDYEATHVWRTAKAVWHNKNILNIFLANFLLFFFYSWMTIYTPLYMHNNIGFSFKEIGIIFSIMLLPFIFVQFPLGRLADKMWGEKEILSLGFVLTAITTAVISFVSGNSMFMWASILFITRIGAATIEVMCDTYFFKKVDCLDTNLISFYRMSGPAAYLIAPLLATLMFNFTPFDIKYLFLVLGLLMFIGLKFSLSIRDTK